MTAEPQDALVNGAGDRLSAAAFEEALREATARLHSGAPGPRLALIPDLRRAMGSRVTREEFDEELLRLRQEGVLSLVPHAHPEFLRSQEVLDALPRTGQVLYLLRWLR